LGGIEYVGRAHSLGHSEQSFIKGQCLHRKVYNVHMEYIGSGYQRSFYVMVSELMCRSWSCDRKFIERLFKER
jgi:hypothetical protein